jgi:hypothetical protein
MKTVYQRDLTAETTHAVLSGLAPGDIYPEASTNGRFVLTPSKQRHLTPHIPSRFMAQDWQMYLAKLR